MQTLVVGKLQDLRTNNFYLNLKNSVKILARWEEDMVSQIMLFENGLNLMRNMGYDSRIHWFESSYPRHECFAQQKSAFQIDHQTQIVGYHTPIS